MKITPQGFAVMDDDRDRLLSRYCEAAGTPIHDAGVAVHYLPHIKPGDVCVDAGAAIGDHTVAYIQKTGNPSLVHAFECSPLMLECLIYNCPGCHVYNCALSDKSEVVFFHQNNDNAGASHVDTVELDGMPVMARALDMFALPKVDFIKWDLEGYEVKAIRGARETIMRGRPIMMIEVIGAQLERAGDSVDALFTELNALNYKWRAVIGELGVPPYFELCCEPL